MLFRSAEIIAGQEEKQEVVFKVVEGRARKVIVKSGIQDKSFIEITEGIQAGDEIVTGPFNAISRTLNDSMLVKIVTEDELFKAPKK